MTRSGATQGESVGWIQPPGHRFPSLKVESRPPCHIQRAVTAQERSLFSCQGCPCSGSLFHVCCWCMWWKELSWRVEVYFWYLWFGCGETQFESFLVQDFLRREILEKHIVDFCTWLLNAMPSSQEKCLHSWRLYSCLSVCEWLPLWGYHLFKQLLLGSLFFLLWR